MQEEIFRKKSLDKMKSPENLDDYIRVSNPGVWLLLVSVIVLLVGACVWSVFGHIDSTVPAIVRVEDGEAVCFLAEENVFPVQAGMIVKYADREAVITGIGGYSEMGYVCVLEADSVAEDGLYEGRVILKSYRPVSFILN